MTNFPVIALIVFVSTTIGLEIFVGIQVCNLKKSLVKLIDEDFIKIQQDLLSTIKKMDTAHQDIHANVESNLREMRGRALKGGAKDVCGSCTKETSSWFINGRGQTICPECKPEGYADALRRGSAHIG